MLTPHDIEVKEFSRSVRGYKTEEVDKFLDEIILDFQELLDENKKLRNSVADLNADLQQYKKSESSMLNTLESAKKLMGDISQSAEKRAEIIINNANANAEAIQREAKESIVKLTEDGERLAVRVKSFKERYRAMLQDELDQIDGSTEDLIAELEREFLRKSSVPSYDDSEIKVADREKKRENKFDTVVVKEKTLEEMLMEDFGSKEGDLTRTIVVKNK
ncbi:MAG: DivIVA domain-containing protein [Eubacteriaceae bacterium]|nr:DivIVA domain-containing protein [Eubacteriaceae bacterium]